MDEGNKRGEKLPLSIAYTQSRKISVSMKYGFVENFVIFVIKGYNVRNMHGWIIIYSTDIICKNVNFQLL